MLIRVGYAHPFFEGYIMKNVPQVTFKTRVKKTSYRLKIAV